MARSVEFVAKLKSFRSNGCSCGRSDANLELLLLGDQTSIDKRLTTGRCCIIASRLSKDVDIAIYITGCHKSEQSVVCKIFHGHLNLDIDVGVGIDAEFI